MHCPKALTQIRQTFHDGIVLLDLEAGDLQAAIDRLVDELVASGAIPPEHRAEICETLLEREQDYPSAIGRGAAVPIAHLDFVARPLIAFARIKEPLQVKTPDEIPVRYLFLLLGKTRMTREADLHIRSATTIARLMLNKRFEAGLFKARDRKDLLAAIDHQVRRNPSRKLPVPDIREEVEGLEWTGRFCGGLIGDIKRRLPHYLDDFKQGFHPKTLAATIFIYFACLAPAIAFGGLMADATDNAIGVVEMIVATAVCGVIYALFSGQPLTILGGTGPLLIFTLVLFDQCKSLGIPFLQTYAWVGLWTGLFTILAAVTDASALIRRCTRFTDEIFAALNSAIFINQSVLKISQFLIDGEIRQDVAFLSLLLAIGTFWVASKIKDFRSSRYLLAPIREFLADFGSVIAIGSMTLIALNYSDIGLASISVPTEIATTSGRDWLVPMFGAGLPVWVIFAAAIPAFLNTILVFLDQNITARLVNAAHYRLEKGPGYHLDLLVVGVMIAGCSLFALPWMYAATVRSLNHMHALATVESVEVSQSGVHERIAGVRETRLSALAIHLLIGLSLLLVPVLKAIPMAVLFGLFLYMGVTSLSSNQFFERIKLWVIDPSLLPSTHYIRQLPIRRIHIFTLVQLVGLTALWVVKESVLAIFFPLVLALLAPLRLWMAGRWFTPEELSILDSEENPEEEQFLEVK